MSRVIRPVLLFGLSFTVLFMMALVIVLSLSEQDRLNLNINTLADDLLLFRCVGYGTVIVMWRPLTRLFSKPAVSVKHMTPELIRQWHERSEQAAKGWWKVALFFALFELVSIQKVGF